MISNLKRVKYSIYFPLFVFKENIETQQKNIYHFSHIDAWYFIKSSNLKNYVLPKNLYWKEQYQQLCRAKL